MTRMWVGAVYIFSGLPLSLLIFSGCQQHFGDPFSNQTLHKHHQKVLPDLVASCTGRCLVWTEKRKPISLQKHAPSFMHLKVESHSLVNTTLTFQDPEQDSETGSQILLLCMKCPHKNLTFFDNHNASEMHLAFGSALETHISHWLVQLPQTSVQEPSISSKCGWWCMFSSKGDFGQHATLLHTPEQYLKWKIRLMVTQGTEMDISSQKTFDDVSQDYSSLWWSWFIQD